MNTARGGRGVQWGGGDPDFHEPYFYCICMLRNPGLWQPCFMFWKLTRKSIHGQETKKIRLHIYRIRKTVRKEDFILIHLFKIRDFLLSVNSTAHSMLVCIPSLERVSVGAVQRFNSFNNPNFIFHFHLIICSWPPNIIMTLNNSSNYLFT